MPSPSLEVMVCQIPRLGTADHLRSDLCIQTWHLMRCWTSEGKNRPAVTWRYGFCGSITLCVSRPGAAVSAMCDGCYLAAVPVTLCTAFPTHGPLCKVQFTLSMVSFQKTSPFRQISPLFKSHDSQRHTLSVLVFLPDIDIIGHGYPEQI